MGPFALTTTMAVQRIQQHDSVRHAFVNTRLDDALAEARQLEIEPPRSPIHGVPFSLKDEWEVAGMATTAGSLRHQHRISPETGPVGQLFSEAGGVLLGKTNLSDLGIPPEATSWVGGATINPYDAAHTAGGSSGGSAAAVAWGMSAFDWGTDIGGSIRLPAAFCGVLGLRLSSETWPQEPIYPRVPDSIAWMCGQGPLTLTIEQMRLVLEAAAPRLKTGPIRPFSLRGAQIWAPKKRGQWPSFADELEPHLQAAIDGHVTRNHGIPGDGKITTAFLSMWASHFGDLLRAEPGLTLAGGTASALSAVFFRGAVGRRRIHPLTAEILLAVILGRMLVFRNKEKAKARAFAIRDAFRRVWDEGYIVVAPVCAYPPPRIGRSNRNLHLLDCTVPGNLADATGLSIPFGRFGHLPRSIQLMGPPGSEDVLLDIAERLIASRDKDPNQIPVRPPAID